ncbi:hypothetical protein HDU92_003900 [Lobulomyces angularis]|nr:hypothetical protein HDU92_003900 [Lobulomyces angularis]
MGIYLYQVVTILRIFQIRQSLVSRVKSHVVSNLYSKSLAMILLLTTAFNFVPLTIDFMFKYCKYVWQIKGLQEPSYCAVPMFKTGTIDSIAWMLQIGTIPIIESVLAFMLVGSLVTLKKHEKKEKALKENEKEDEFHFSATASDKQKQNNNSKKIKNILRNVLMWITITWVAALLNIFTVFYVFHPKFSSDNDSNYNIAWVIQQFSYFMTTIEFSLFNIWRNKKFKDNTNTPKAANIKDKKRVSKTAVEVEDF